MSLVNAKMLFKYGQLMVNETVLKNVRYLGVTKLRTANNTATEETKKISEAAPPTIGEINASGQPSQDFEKLNADIAELTSKNSELLDKYKRALADGENLRTRLTKQIAEAKIFGIQGFCKDLLDIADVLSRATETVPKEEINDNNPHLKTLYEGLVITEAQLQSVFKRHGLQQVNPNNEKFDPNFHEALFQQEVEGKTPGTVVVVSKIGYKLHDRVIRPALVGVAK